MQVSFDGDASIETGSPYVGLEFHHSSPLAQRISFYYPVANSIDLSSDYWTRDQWVSMLLGLKIGDGPMERIGSEPYKTVQTPYEVTFHRADSLKSVVIIYRFSKDSPVFVVSYEITNLDSIAREFEFYTSLEASLKTSHKYAIKDKARSEFSEEGAAIYFNWDDPETQFVQLFSANAGLMPVAWNAVSMLDSLPVPQNRHEVPGTDLTLNLIPIPVTNPNPNSNSNTNTNTNSNHIPDPNPDPNQIPYPVPHPDPESDPDPDHDSDPDPDPDPDPDSDSNSNPDTNPDPDFKSDLNLNFNLDSDPHTPAFRYLYRQELVPGEAMKVVQITGSARQGEGLEIVGKLLLSHRQETDAYEAHILGRIREKPFITGDPVLDKSVLWSHGILEANMHYIDGSIQPMPCPAQYNFYFTHDVLLSDQAAVNFDLPRVRKDLAFIISHADTGFVIPHAYYWKDHGYATELAPPDNWNHFWFVITAARYLRHSGDEVFLRELYPYLVRSVEDFQTHNIDGIIYSYRPDWWDIAWNFGPRSYTTILAARALREFVFISAVLGENEGNLVSLEADAARMQAALNEKLWSDGQDYLINYFEDGSPDTHYYIGSLTASHYDLLEADRKEKLAATATRKIVDPQIGVYTVWPMDFHTLTDYLKLNGNEAGDPFYYINGGIWPHGNAWYALALMETGKNDAAHSFIRDVMTLDGVINSPNGQPAMYEYRVSKKDDPSVYGKIDKPQFTWAAAWYLYSLYNLYGVKESEWNIRLDPWMPEGGERVQFVLATGGNNAQVRISGQGGHVEDIRFDHRQVFTTVLPYLPEPRIDVIDITMGRLKTPLLTGLSAILLQAGYEEAARVMTVEVAGFPGHQVKAVIESPYPAENVILNGAQAIEWTSVKYLDVHQIEIEFIQNRATDEIAIVFTGE